MDDADIPASFGRAIRARRRALDLSQQALAKRAGMNPKHLGEIERGETDPRLTTVLKLAAALDTPAAELVRRTRGG